MSTQATYRLRWTVPVDIIVTVKVGTDELDSEDDLSVEEHAYDLAVERVKNRLEQIAVSLDGVAVHGDIDGIEADEVERTDS